MARNLAVADCETDPFKIGRVPQPFIWGFYDGTDYREFNSTGDFVSFIKSESCIIFAHNGGKFDWHFILPELDPYSDIMIINGRIARTTCGYAELRDSYNIIPVPLSEYKKDDIDYAIMEVEERNKPKNKAAISKYLRSDCVYLHELITGFVDRFGLQITQASAAMSQWKKISASKTPSSTKEFYDVIAPYYYGGRVQCFESGIIDTEFKIIDINSAYPRGMMDEHPYSTEYTQVEHYVPDADFYRVRCVSHGAFPYRGEGDPGEFAGLRFPMDNEMRTYTITGWEYKVAKKTKTITRDTVLESLIFSDHTNFKQYIEHFYNMRMKAKAEGNAAESLFAKLLMNSLYGKFASNPDNYRNYMICPMDVIGGLASQGWDFAGEFGPWALAEAPLLEEQKKYYNIATGASITGYVRAFLWESICKAKGVLYVDTDGMPARDVSNLAMGDKLGEWKQEPDETITFDRAGIGGKKLYVFRSVPLTASQIKKYEKYRNANGTYRLVGNRLYKTASKGARLTLKQLWEVAEGGLVNYVPDVPTFSVNKAPVFTPRNIKYTAKKEKVG